MSKTIIHKCDRCGTSREDLALTQIVVTVGPASYYAAKRTSEWCDDCLQETNVKGYMSEEARKTAMLKAGKEVAPPKTLEELILELLHDDIAAIAQGVVDSNK